ncbi:S46 family peptidase [Neiella sp. HB171785]|uniref:Dipeptidyl-peptidase n=1 Tax=Neiella litorisoli TaxID=2771431 RepID=A0A8J6QFL7_9GAMM|nr:S46 family peptidase [Neiella litorisoli]MBD1388505.1 S46 family peptidase [Neiella litorisoli]
MKTKLTIVAAMALSAAASADEGQWQPHQLTQLQHEFDRVGIELPASQVADLNQYPLNAVVGLGYCSASFVSPKGLVVTNHHCAYGAIQNNSTPENNLIEKGFLAGSMAGELPAGPQERLYVTESVEDVTAEVTGTLADDLHGKARYDAIAANRKALISECETDPNYRCSVRAFHHGLEYFLIKQLMIKDVRLVYAPAEALGNFGGDIDNFEYPRHTADFTFVRGYVGKDGKPAEYSEDNVPYQPKSFLKVNTSGVKLGDGVLVAGYPGRTSRYKLADEVNYSANWYYPTLLDTYYMTLDTIAEATQGREAAEVKYASRVKSINNRLKKLLGLQDGFKATDIEGIKRAQEQQYLSWFGEDASRQSFTVAHQQLQTLLSDAHAQQQRQFYYNYAINSDLLNAAIRLYRLAKESEKANADREMGYQERDLPMFKARLQRLQTKFDPAVDQALWVSYLAAYLDQDQSRQIADLNSALGLKSTMSRSDLEALVAAIYGKTELANAEARVAWIGKSVAEFEQSADPLIALAVALYDANMTVEAEQKEMAGRLAEVRPQYMAAVIAFNNAQGKPVYPDANSTLRVSYAQVDGYPAADGIYKTPFTSLRGLVAKHTGEKPFIATDSVLMAHQNKAYGDYYRGDLGAPAVTCGLFSFGCEAQAARPLEVNSVPVNFLSSADTTGGNSGSPVMNGKGELVGLNFDSTYESITKDWYFNGKITRAIHVDIRYVLWLMTEVDNADYLLDEMTLVQ